MLQWAEIVTMLKQHSLTLIYLTSSQQYPPNFSHLFSNWFTMRVSTSSSLLFLFYIPAFPNAQSAVNPEANPDCSTVASIVDSCAIKIPGLATAASSIVFSCLLRWIQQLCSHHLRRCRHSLHKFYPDRVQHDW